MRDADRIGVQRAQRRDAPEMIDIRVGNNSPPYALRVQSASRQVGHEILLGRTVHAHIEKQRAFAAGKEVEAGQARAKGGVDAMNAGRDLDRYSPLNCGSRFSTKARRPSAASAVNIK